MAKKTKEVVNPYPKVAETFNRYITIYQQHEPSCFNQIVEVRKYRATIELVDEPIEVIQKRIQDLWDNSKNYHDYQPLKTEANKYNYELIGSRGNKDK